MSALLGETSLERFVEREEFVELEDVVLVDVSFAELKLGSGGDTRWVT